MTPPPCHRLPIQGGMKRWTVGDQTHGWWLNWMDWLLSTPEGYATMLWDQKVGKLLPGTGTVEGGDGE